MDNIINLEKGKKVFIYSRPDRESAFGIHEWTSDSSGRKLKKTKIGKTRDAIQALFNPKFGGLANGLSYKPWIEGGVQVTDSDGTPLTLQDKMEKKWNLPKGYLTNKSWRKGDSLKEEDMTYYQKKVWKLNDGCTVLDLSNFDDEMFYYVALDSKFVANSEREMREHKWPKSTHYIALENEAEEIKFKKNEIRSKAFASLHDKDMTPTMKEKIIAILELASSRTQLNQEQVHNLLFEYIDKSSFEPGSNIEKYNQLYSNLKTAHGREEIEARFLLRKALDSRIIHEKQGAYIWVRAKGTITIGETISEAIEFLLNPKKQSLVDELEEEITLKNK